MTTTVAIKGDEAVQVNGNALAEAVERERDLRRQIHNAIIGLEGLREGLRRAQADVRKYRRATVKASRLPLWPRIVSKMNGWT